MTIYITMQADFTSCSEADIYFVTFSRFRQGQNARLKYL